MAEVKPKKKSRILSSPRVPPEGDSAMSASKPSKKRSLPKLPTEHQQGVGAEKSTPTKYKKLRSSSSISSSRSSLSSEIASDLEKQAMEISSHVESSTNGEDNNFVKAVAKARGKPDGEQREASPATKKSKTIAEQKDKPTEGKKKSKIFSKVKKFSDSNIKPGTKRKSTDTDDNEPKKSRKQLKKEKVKEKRCTKPNYELSTRAVDIWGQLRRMDLTDAKRTTLCDELSDILKGKAKQLIFSHDTSRVIQCLMKYGSQVHRDQLFEELREHIMAMVVSKYAKFFVRKLLKYGSKSQRDYVFRSFYTNVRTLVKNTESAGILEFAYNDYANALQRSQLIEEFYGPRFALFKTNEVKTLAEIVESSPEKRDTIISNMKDILSSLVNKTVLQYSIVHRVFVEYFMYATVRQKKEMVEIVREHLIHMLHTRDGSRVAMFSLWNGSPKDRKVIIKSMKGYVSKICQEEHGHMVMLALFDCVDDTKIVCKVIIEEMFQHIEEIHSNAYGRKVLMYLLNARDTKHCHPDIIKVLEQGDNNPNSKKDTVVRRKELLDAVSPLLYKYLETNMEQVVLTNSNIVLLLAALTHATGDCSSVMTALAQVAAEPFIANNNDKQHLVEQPAGNMLLKKLIQNDKQRIQDGKPLFTKTLLDVVPGKSLRAWAACNRGCFILLSIIELGEEDLANKVKAEVSPLTSTLQRMDFKGAQLLLSKL